MGRCEPCDLHAVGHKVDMLLPFDAMHFVHDCQHRPRVVFSAPACVRRAYLPLASSSFQTWANGAEREEDDSDDLVLSGNVGLGFGLTSKNELVVSVEAAALMELLRELRGTPEESGALDRLSETWSYGQCLVAFSPRTGWRGCFAEHRLWSSVLHAAGKTTRTRYCKPVVRAWFPPLVLDDLRACVGEALVARVAAVVADHGFDGAPDLVLYRHGVLRFVEVKSATDHLKEAQVRMIQALTELDGVEVQLCCPRASRKRFATVLSDA